MLEQTVQVVAFEWMSEKHLLLHLCGRRTSQSRCSHMTAVELKRLRSTSKLCIQLQLCRMRKKSEGGHASNLQLAPFLNLPAPVPRGERSHLSNS